MNDKLPGIALDRDLHNADWTKRTWSLPPYKSERFMELLHSGGQTLEDFRKLPVYQHAVAQGLIVNDEWKGK